MTTWTSDELAKIGAAEELQIAPELSDSALRKPVTIWVVRNADDLYVRPVNGRNASWFRAAQERHKGRIWASDVEKNVTFMEVDSADKVNDAIDAAYRAKYHRYAANIVNSVLTPKARAATIKLTPRA